MKHKINLYKIFTAGLMLIFCCSSQLAISQIKIGENNKSMNADAILEIESMNKGFLLPRIALVSTTNPLPLKTFTSGMVVYNTSNSNDLSTGLYYSDGSKWIRANNNTTASLFFSAQNHTEIVAIDGQTVFKTPGTITDQTKIFLYRNGILITHTINNNNSITAELPCRTGDQIRIIQLL